MGNPKNHMELINPSCSADKPNSCPSWGRIPARIAKVKAVVIRAKQLPLNSALLFKFSFILVGFKRLMINICGLILKHSENIKKNQG